MEFYPHNQSRASEALPGARGWYAQQGETVSSLKGISPRWAAGAQIWQDWGPSSLTPGANAGTRGPLDGVLGGLPHLHVSRLFHSDARHQDTLSGVPLHLSSSSGEGNHSWMAPGRTSGGRGPGCHQRASRHIPSRHLQDRAQSWVMGNEG